MARLVLCALAALARAYDWTTPDAGLTPFNCTAYPNPIQVLLAEGQSPPYNVSELDLATGEYTKICPNGFPTTKKVNGFALMQYPATGPQGPTLADKVYGFVCRDRKLQRFDCDSISQVDGNLVQQGNDAGKTCNAATFVGSTYYYTNGLQGANNQIYLVSDVDTDAPVFSARGDAKFNVSDKVLKGAENDITSLEEDTTGAFTELIADGQPGRKYVVGLAEGSVGAELFVARLDENAPGTPAYYAVLYTACANVDWSLRPKNAQPPTPKNGCLRSTFGAAYTYDERTSSATSLTQAPRLFFSNNGGYGLFEVIIPPGGIPIPEGRDGCWNTGDPSVPGNTHYSCGAKGDRQQGLSFQIKWVAQSAETSNNDGSACPGIAAPVFPTMAPTITETPTQQPTVGLWSNPEKPFDCDAHPNPIQVYGPQKPPPPFNTEELDLGTGDYTAIADFSPVPPTTPAYGSQNVNGFALMRNPDNDKVYAFICVFDELKLVRFDSTRSTDVPPGAGSLTGQRIDPTKSGEKVNAAAFIKTTYYYTSRLKKVGNGETYNSIFYVSDVNTNSPSYFGPSTRKFSVKEGLLTGSVADITNLEEDSGEIIKDGCDGCSYLVGLAAGSDTTPPEVFLARIEQGGLVPEYYAVLEAASCDVYVDVPTGPGCIEGDFGAAYTYGGGGVPQQVFFTNNNGAGLFEVTAPPGGIDVPATCWNIGINGVGTEADPTAPHTRCAGVSFTLTWKAASQETNQNDGSACPGLPAPVFPTDAPTAAPTALPTPAPTVTPTANPSPAPTTSTTTRTPAPVELPTDVPTPVPSSMPTTPLPSPGPTATPTAAPTAAPSAGPTAAPTAAPTAGPSSIPTIAPTGVPTAAPSAGPSSIPTLAPTGAPTVPPTAGPTAAPTLAPTATHAPTRTETYAPTRMMTEAPSYAPTTDTYAPTTVPTCVEIKQCVGCTR